MAAQTAASVHRRRHRRGLPLRAVGAAGRVLHHQVLDRPAAGRIFFEQVIRDNLDIGRPDKVSIVFDRKIRRRGKNPTPGPFRTQRDHQRRCPYLYIDYKHSQIKQYLKLGRTSVRTETTLNDGRATSASARQGADEPRRHGRGRLPANRRLLDAECISHDPSTEPPRCKRSPARSSAHLHPHPRDVIPRPPRPGPPRRLLRPGCRPAASPAATCGTTSPPQLGKTQRT